MTRPGNARALLALLWLALPTASAAPVGYAAEIEHRVAPGDDLESIALTYFGSGQAAALIALHNRLPAGRPVEAGAKLRIPAPSPVAVEETTRWSTLAETHWGDAALARDLAEANLSSETDPVAAGARVVIPDFVSYVVQPGNNLIRLSRRYYGTSGRASMLRRVNGMAKDRPLLIGARLRLPAIAYGTVVPTRAGAQAQVAASPAVAAGLGGVASSARGSRGGDHSDAIRKAINAYLEGRYEESLSSLEALRPAVLAEGNKREQSELLTHLIFLYAAYGRDERACESYRALQEVAGTPDWDPDFVSPRILASIGECQTPSP